ncbi:hypothetical protein GALMADRAFT_221558 [Galerina marginata CBS 339.88]|uniref:Uncharacterized protein n=1 Tax=Galerina marginata (strain CBS 339.88) TaxID=685588 RepID=A0A067TH55_GALM3|nr:hypothetical protein GALMADRAFT_221558 [Galerina marginata CBS 339.88]
MQSKDSRQVNNLLHNLRGEQFRQLQNVKRSRAHLSTISSHNAPTLPRGLTIPDYDDVQDSNTLPAPAPPTPSYSGPAPPKSWRPIPEKDVHESEAWRAKALSVVALRLDNFTDSSRVPSLALICLKMILEDCSSSREFREEVVPFIPPHLRRDVVRYCAIHSPLPERKLYDLFNTHGHTDGEIIIMGPSATLREHHFLRAIQFSEDSIPSRRMGPTQEILDWEAEDLSGNPLHSLILVSARLNTSTLLTFPPTVTHLALVNLPTPVPLYRISKTCPLLIVLDISYNFWLYDAIEAATALDRIEWSRWGHLEVLGLRGCCVPVGLTEELNKGRWDDVEIIH